jgi:hypothetical protein
VGGLADRMRDAGIEFTSLPTYGPTVLYIGHEPHYGPKEVKRVVDILTTQTRTQEGA